MAGHSELKVDPGLADHITPEHLMTSRDIKSTELDRRREFSPDGSLSPRGLSIQFPVSPNLLGHTIPNCDLPPRPEGPEAAGQARRPRVAISGDLASDLRQIQRELNWLARTENMKLTHGASFIPYSPDDEIRRWSSISDDSNETCLEDDSIFSDTFRGDSPRGVPDRLKVLGAEFDLRNAVVQRLAELNGQRNQTHDVGSALRQLAQDCVQLGRAIAHAELRTKVFCASLLILFSAVVCKAFFL